MRLEIVQGDALRAVIGDLARLRIAVFREYPYLYDGSLAYEAGYLATYAASDEAIAVLARDGADIVGASTAVPMAHESAAFQQPFIDLGLDPRHIFYCGESVLLPQYRGHGLYRGFFQAREERARAGGGFSHICFCAVERPPTHPLRPAHWQPLDAVWRHFGYAPEPRLRTSYEWKDIDEPAATAHPMQFWLKELRA
jgi:GNAT superfamily N-acetyltransferase